MRINIREKYSTKDFDKKLSDLLSTIKKEEPLILIQGGYGKNNLGDDALLLTIYANVKNSLPKAQIIALCHFPNNVKTLYGIEALFFSEKAAISALMKCDCLIIGGGGIVNIINTYSGLHFFKIFDPKGKYLFLTSLLTKIRRKKVVFYGVGMTSIPDKIVFFLMWLTLRHIDIVSVRDKISYSTAKRFSPRKDVLLMHDPALNYNIQMTTEQKQKVQSYEFWGHKYIVISVRAIYNQEITENVITVLKDTILYLNDAFPESKIVILPVSIHPNKTLENDLIISKKLYDSVILHRNNVFLVNTYLHPSQVQYILHKAQMIIMTRLHGIILSYDYNVPTIILAYDNKVKCFGEMAGYDYILNYNQLNFNQLKEAVINAKEKIDV